ncbi:cysteine--tRNA ligase [Insulibacter thermoxylanivorax]|uniref:Cysteine--tRNA ligase n=1 Tax=Insulibacter thermoxylanivorax TaxID=2749268 RepID=A0A916VG04_9BACL|nr:cysteine--tRNA ligase [Insulibacter thermoxylanivorax]GFR38872.1 cysteine--tRNA ligase [Insulibacter thermoxylanivorax]
MTIKIYNSLTRKKKTFEPYEANKVRMYVCGPTVYDYIHIGNARPLIFFDVVRRYLERRGYEVRYIVNFTDVDDKLIRKSEETGMSVPEIADTYIAAYFEDAEALGIRRATVHPRVTENMKEIIDFIQGLIDQDLAYESGGDVYFRTAKFPEYGKLSHQNLEELQYGIRIEVDERKADPRDFVLWKAAKPGEIRWDSPWGEGRPGWHIECSAMAKKYLGETIDIHGGGQDLQFPHHECEIAQSEGLHGRTFARYWMHNGYININNEKMSKSLGNGINVKELLKRVRPNVVRFFMLSTHYRNPLNFSDEAIAQAEGAVARIENSVTNLKHRLQTVSRLQIPIAEEQEIQQLERETAAIIERFDQKMSDDFNTPDALSAVFELVSLSNQLLQQEAVDRRQLELLLQAYNELNDVLGILRDDAAEEELLDEEIERLIAERTEARKAKNWKRADEIRDMLQERGIILEDTPQGVRWRRR